LQSSYWDPHRPKKPYIRQLRDASQLHWSSHQESPYFR
jgi:hypothetical protein